MPNILVLLSTCRERSSLQKQPLSPFLKLSIIPNLLSHIRLSLPCTRRNSFSWRRCRCSLSARCWGQFQTLFPGQVIHGDGKPFTGEILLLEGNGNDEPIYTLQQGGGIFALLLGCVTLCWFVRG